MSGHSKWHTIKHKKGAADAKRGKIFTRIIKELTIAAKLGGGDPDANPRLRTVIAEAKSHNMPAENIRRAIRRGTGEEEGVSYEEVTYEGYGPGGIAVIVDAVTDNRNRTVAEVRLVFSRNGGNLAESGAVSWQFDTRGVVAITAGDQDPDDIQLAAIEAGALDVEVSDDGTVEVITEPGDLHTVRDALEAQGFTIDHAELSQVPQNRVHLDPEDAGKALRLFERLDDLDDVSRVYSNLEFDEAALEAAAQA